MTNLLYSLASNSPKNFGIYRKYVREDIEELLAHYEDDLCDAAPYLDAEGITRLAQTLYLLKSKEFEGIWWRIENRVS